MIPSLKRAVALGCFLVLSGCLTSTTDDELKKANEKIDLANKQIELMNKQFAQLSLEAHIIAEQSKLVASALAILESAGAFAMRWLEEQNREMREDPAPTPTRDQILNGEVPSLDEVQTKPRDMKETPK